MPAGLKNKVLLDPKTCWKEWHVYSGSLGETRKKFLKEGLINAKTGNPPTISAIEKSAFSWALKNLEEARKDLYDAWAKEGYVLTDHDWKRFLKDASRLVFYQTPDRLSEFMKNNNL